MLCNHGITLVQLENKHLEIMRLWRNSSFVRVNMLNPKVISSEEHLNWFTNLDTNKNFHFIIENKNKWLGSCSIKLIDNNSAEGGIFMAEDDKSASLLPVKAICILYDWAFGILGVDCIEAKIIQKNKRAINFNKGLGFKVKKIEHDIVYAVLYNSNFYGAYSKFKHLLS